MYQPTRISPSILSADFCNLQAEIDTVAKAGADWIHFDVMDGHFVPNITVGIPVLSCVRSVNDAPIDVHLMISNPLEQAPWFFACHPDYVTIHWEALDDGNQLAQAQQFCQMAKEAGVHPGIALKPDTPVSVLSESLALWDMVLVMSVYPGFSGQSFIPDSASRIAQLRDMFSQADVAPLVQVDGGINAQTASIVAAQGADVLVAGNAVFKANDYASAIADIRTAADTAHAQVGVSRA